MHFSPIRLYGISQSHIIQDLIKYKVPTVTQLVPSQSTNYYYEIFVSHHSFIVQRTIVGEAIIVRNLLTRGTIHFSCGVGLDSVQLI